MKKLFIGVLSVFAALFIIIYTATFIKHSIGYSVIIPVVSSVLCLACAFALKEMCIRDRNRTPRGLPFHTLQEVP